MKKRKVKCIHDNTISFMGTDRQNSLPLMWCKDCGAIKYNRLFICKKTGEWLQREMWLKPKAVNHG